MTFRCPDVWVLDVYLDEAGWDGQRQQIYFSTRRDAENAGEILKLRVEGITKGPVSDGTGLDVKVYQITPNGSFYQKDQEFMAAVKVIADDIGITDQEQMEW